MKALTGAFLSFSFLLHIYSCVSDGVACDGNDAREVKTFYDDEFAKTPCILQGISATDEVVNLVIKTQGEYDKYVSCSIPPPVDFEKYIILAGRYRHHQCASFVSQRVTVCVDKLSYQVILLQKDCLAVTNVYYLVVIERKYEDSPIAIGIRFE